MCVVEHWKTWGCGTGPIEKRAHSHARAPPHPQAINRPGLHPASLSSAPALLAPSLRRTRYLQKERQGGCVRRNTLAVFVLPVSLFGGRTKVCG